MEKITRHLLSGGRALDLWTYPEATPAGQGEGPALDHAEILLLLRIVPLAATTAADVVAAAPDSPPSSSGKLPIYAYGRPSANCVFGRRSTCGQGLFGQTCIWP